MIAVIADDLSGAAELASVAARFGLSAEVHTRFNSRPSAELIAIDTDTRAMSAGAAATRVAAVTRAVLAAQPEWIFKKTDSVLRGHVRVEVEAILSETKQSQAMLIPANPTKNRIIRKGIYYVDGTPLADTIFRNDPHHPRISSRIADLLGPDMTGKTISVPDITCRDDLNFRAAQLTSAMLPAGGVDFFDALLRMRCEKREVAAISLSTGRTLFICGSAAAWDHGRANLCATHRIPIAAMPDSIFRGESDLKAMKDWQVVLWDAFDRRGHAMLAIAQRSTAVTSLSADELLSRLIDTAAIAISSPAIDQFCIEGGATAAAILRKFGWTRLTALPTPWPAVATLQPPSGPRLLIKPGSYPWPESLF